MRIIVGGFLGLLPAGGITWDYIQYPLGFAALGHDVYYVEDTRLWPIYQLDPSGQASCAANVAHLGRVMSAFGLSGKWAYRDEVSGNCYGLSKDDLDEVCRTADVFVNISCSTVIRDEYRSIPLRVLVDSDPMFTQIQYVTQTGFTEGESGIRRLVSEHTHHFTFGESIGEADCRIPATPVDWRPTRQPICLDHWPVTPMSTVPEAAFTTVMNWTAGRPLLFDGETWGQKDVEFMRVFDTPRRSSARLAVVVGQTTGTPFPVDDARSAGWEVLQPGSCAPDWGTYRNFIQQSFGEFSVAKESYVKGRTGWFSCRSACYLASGRPVVTQDTGWSSHLPSGVGLMAFSSADEAVASLDEVMGNPKTHSRAARRIAEEAFDARDVLGSMLSEIGAS